jgi:hypothetical protein
VFSQERYSKSLGANNGTSLLIREIKARCERANVRQMLFDFVPCLALHIGILCERRNCSASEQPETWRGKNAHRVGSHPQIGGRLLSLNDGGEVTDNTFTSLRTNRVLFRSGTLRLQNEENSGSATARHSTCILRIVIRNLAGL